MTRYKQELQLRGFTNLPTIKVLELKNGIRVCGIDNFDVRSVKTALEHIEKKQKKKVRKITFTLNSKYVRIDNLQVFRTNQTEKTFYIKDVNMNTLKQILDYKYHLIEINRKKCNMFVDIDNYVECYNDFNVDVSITTKTI